MTDPIEKLADQMTQVRLDIRELTTEVRNLKDVQHDVVVLKKEIVSLDASTKSAHKRLDNYDKQFWGVWLLIVAGVVKLAFDFFTSK